MLDEAQRATEDDLEAKASEKASEGLHRTNSDDHHHRRIYGNRCVVRDHAGNSKPIFLVKGFQRMILLTLLGMIGVAWFAYWFGCKCRYWWRSW